MTDGEALKELFRQRNAIDAEIQRRLHRLDKSRAYEADGSLTAKAWLRWNCNLTHGQASDRVEVARQMQSLPLTSQALAKGHISYQHASLIARTKQRLGVLWPGDAEEILVTAAKEVDPVRLRFATMQLRHCLEPDGVLDDANEDDKRRFLHLNQTFGGIFVLNGQFGAEDGATLKAAIMSVLRPPAEGDDRSPAQRRADALIDLVKSGSPKPQVMVNVDMATLQKQPGSRAAELDGSHQPIPAETARRIACDCSLIPNVDGEPQRTARVVPGPTRRALAARDRHCRFPGCDMPPMWTDAHHIQHWADGGSHQMFNLILLCRRHHRLVHEGRWRLVSAGDGVLQAVPP
ncbi:MAG TPA: DUF222 domain-containing protein [Candidatus Dormibacteraeota bacterium]|nr:DUF222 domain-containing protein [Candidatus Dormibacteraeota bacterium]